MKKPIYDDNHFFNNYLHLRKEDYNYNDYIEMPYIINLLGDFKGKTILDIGCGYGTMCRYFASLGAKNVYGVDVSNNMIDKAKRDNQLDGIEYSVLDADNLYLINKKFDIVYSSLCFHYIKDLDFLFKNINSILNEKGRLVFSMEHPMMTATMKSNSWKRDKDGNYLVYYLDSYSIEGERNVEWLGTKIKKYHRTISTIINLLIKNGFRIDELSEAPIPKEIMDHNQTMQKDIHRPSYLMVACTKTSYGK